MTTSMIKGNPLKLMLQFAFPLLLGNLLQQTYNIIDAAIVGQILGAKALASVGASSSIQFLVLGFCMGSCTGFGVPVAKYFGAEKIEKMRDYIFNGAVLCAGIAVILTALCSVLCPQILHILSVPEDIYDNAYSYLLIIFLGIPFTILYNYLSSILRSVGDSRTPFIFLALSAVLNISGFILYRSAETWMCRSCHCNHFRTGNQWNLVPYFYYPQNETSVAQERKQDNKRGCSKGTSGNGNAYGTSVLHHSYRKYGYAVCEQRAWKYICISFYCSNEDQAVYHVSI